MGDYVNFHDAPKPPKKELPDHEVFNNALMRAQAAGEKPSAALFAQIDKEYNEKKKEKQARLVPLRDPLIPALLGAAYGTAGGGLIAPKGKLLKYMLGGAAGGGAIGGAMGLGQNLGSMTGDAISRGMGLDEKGTASAATQIGTSLAGLGGGAYLGLKAHKRIGEELEFEDEPKKKEKAAMSLYSFGAKLAQSTCSPCDMPNGPTNTNKKPYTSASPAVTDASQKSVEIGKPPVTETEHSEAKTKLPEEGVKSARIKQANPLLKMLGMGAKPAATAAQTVSKIKITPQDLAARAQATAARTGNKVVMANPATGVQETLANAGGGITTPQWVRQQQAIQRGIDPRTGVRPGSVAPAAPPPTAPKVKISPAEAAAGRAKVTITPQDVSQRFGTGRQIAPPPAPVPPPMGKGAAMAFGVKVADALGDNLFNSLSPADQQAAMTPASPATAPSTSMFQASRGMLPKMQSSPNSRYATENVNAGVPGAVEAFKAQQAAKVPTPNMGVDASAARKAERWPAISTLDVARRVPGEALNMADNAGRAVGKTLFGGSGKALGTPNVNFDSSGPQFGAPAGKSPISDTAQASKSDSPASIDRVQLVNRLRAMNNLPAMPDSRSFNEFQTNLNKSVAEMRANARANGQEIPSVEAGAEAVPSKPKTPSTAGAKTTHKPSAHWSEDPFGDKPAPASTLAQAMEWMGKNPGYTAAGGLGAAGLAGLLYHMNQPKKKKRDDDEE
jgi:hypothetical protein